MDKKINKWRKWLLQFTWSSADGWCLLKVNLQHQKSNIIKQGQQFRINNVLTCNSFLRDVICKVPLVDPLMSTGEETDLFGSSELKPKETGPDDLKGILPVTDKRASLECLLQHAALIPQGATHAPKNIHNSHLLHYKTHALFHIKNQCAIKHINVQSYFNKSM